MDADSNIMNDPDNSNNMNDPEIINISNDPEKSQDGAVDSEIKVGDIKDIQQSDMVSISKDYNKIKAAEASVNSNFLFLRAGANALLPKKGPKRAPRPKKVIESAEKKEERGPDSPKSGSSEDRNRPKVIEKSPFYCHVCEVELNSEATYMTHIEGKKHQKKLDTAEIKLPRRVKRTERLQYMKIKEGCRIQRIPKPDEQPHMLSTFDNIKEPCLGLQFISEIWPLDENAEDVYYCSLCAINCGPNAVVSHIIGFKHRLAYMKLYDASNYEEVKNLSSKKSELTAVLHAHAMKLEKRDGTGKVKVEIEVDDDLEYDNYGGAMGNIPLNPKNLHHLPSTLKMKFLEETMIASEDIPPYINQQHADSLNATLQNLKAAVARYSPLDNMLKKRILIFLEQTAAVENTDHTKPDSWGNAPPSASSSNEYMSNPGPSEQMRGSASNFMYNSGRTPPSAMAQDRRGYGQMNKSSYSMGTRQGAGYAEDSISTDIPPFPYGNNQASTQPTNEMWGPMPAAGRDTYGAGYGGGYGASRGGYGGGTSGYGGGGYDQFPRQGGQKRLFSERGD